MQIALWFTLLVSLVFPFLAMWWERSPKLPGFFSAVVLCYIFGILLGNLTPEWVDLELAESLAGGAMLIALPLLLFGSNIRANWRLAGPGLIAFGLCALAGLIGTGLAAWYFAEQQPDGWKVAGMLTGLYTGGTPNVQAIGIALDAPQTYVVLLQAADILGGGAYLLLLMTVMKTVLGWFLPDFKLPARPETDQVSPNYWTTSWQPLALSMVVGGVAAGITYLLTGDLGGNTTLLILLLTTISVGLSLHPKISHMSSSYPIGEYFLLIFCVALGLMANFKLLVSEGLPLLAFSMVALVATIVLHILLSFFFKVDRDTVIISATAALYGPVFIAQVTESIGNKRLLAPGIALSLLGLAVGNYLGIGVAWLAHWLFW